MALPFTFTVAVLPLASAAHHHCLYQYEKRCYFGIIITFYFSSENKTLDVEPTSLFSDTGEVAINQVPFCCTPLIKFLNKVW
jgi:hypothetical protein